MSISKELQRKMDYYEQVYFSLDEPIPFREDLVIYPVKVRDYYKFYNCIPCLTFDKMYKTVYDEAGREKKVVNPVGIAQSNLKYLIGMMEDEETGQMTILQLMQLFELVFHINRGIFCPKCGKEKSYQEAFSGMEEYTSNRTQEFKDLILKQYYEQNSDKNHEDDKDFDFDEEFLENIKKMAQGEFLQKSYTCPECGERMRDIFAIKDDNGQKTITIRNYEFTKEDFDEFKALVPRYNMLDYDGDKYMNQDLKEELELKAKLKNQDYTSPTLEKQMLCVIAGTSYKIEELKELPIRKLSYLLRIVDKKGTYYAQLQGQMSGMVTFKEEPKHWIFSNDKHNIKDELTDFDTFQKKFEHVT